MSVKASVDATDLDLKVRQMYRAVAENPSGSYHFEMGRGLAERLGYRPAVLDRVAAGAVESFAGVGYVFDLAGLGAGETVLDLGSGSGMDAFVAATLVGPAGRVIGVDFTAEQLAKARRLAGDAGVDHVEFREGRIENLPVDDASVDCVISNGVINLSPDKGRVFHEAARVLRPGGRLAIADIVSETPFTDSIVRDTDLWASCIAGAAHREAYLTAIAAAGFTVESMTRNPYEFISARARDASAQYGVISVSLLARRSRI
jgi:ubiquinone/menaquinone biosynthesis C-methylase UbiE